MVRDGVGVMYVEERERRREKVEEREERTSSVELGEGKRMDNLVKLNQKNSFIKSLGT